MKTLLLTFSLLFAASSIAGTCFKAQTTPAAETKLPEVICVENYKFETILPGLPKDPFYQASVETSVGSKKEAVRFYDFQKAPFVISVELPVHSEEWGGCSYSYRTKVVVNFRVDANGNTLENQLSVTGLVEENNDPCHLGDRETKIPYYKI